jgi:hypothetical protein
VVQGIAGKAGKRIGLREKIFGSGGDRKLKFRKLYGIVVATVTPLTGDGKLNLEALGLL